MRCSAECCRRCFLWDSAKAIGIVVFFCFCRVLAALSFVSQLDLDRMLECLLDKCELKSLTFPT